MKAALTSRLAQIVARCIGFMLAGLGIGELTPELQDSITGFAGATVTLIAGVALVVWDFLTHKIETGGVMKPAGSQKCTVQCSLSSGPRATHSCNGTLKGGQ